MHSNGGEPIQWTDAQNAVTLLDALVNNHNDWLLSPDSDEVGNMIGGYRFKIIPHTGKSINHYADTIGTAVVGAVLELIARGE